MRIEHKPITPRHPQANGLAENFNRMVNKVVCTATIERKSWKQELYKFLRNYKATPHLTTGKCPADLLFQKRPYRICLPEQLVPVLCDKEFRQRDAQQKLKAKQYADRKVYVKKSTLVPGDVVLVKNEKKGKMVTYYDPKPYIFTNTKGSMITAKRDEPRQNSDKELFLV